MFWKRRRQQRPSVFSFRSRPRLEHLEDRLAPAVLSGGSESEVGPDDFGYVARSAPFEDFDIVGQPDTQTLTVTTGTPDDGAGSINLGANSFNFYGTVYVGINQLFVSTNGLISFGGAFTAFENNDLTNPDGMTDPALIAVLWDDLDIGPGSPQIAFRFDGIGDGDASNDRLTIQWNQVEHFFSGPSPITFQVILQLNTGSNVGAILFNYVDLDTESPSTTDGASATIGIKREGAPEGQRLLVSFNGTHPLVGSGRAICLTKDARFLDDGDPGFTTTTGWSLLIEGFQGDVRFASPGTGSLAATWTFTNVVPGVYRVSATWSEHENRASDAPYYLYNGGLFAGAAVINQQLAPDDFGDQGAMWEDLGGMVSVTTGTLQVFLLNAADGFVIADGIRILRVGDLPAVQVIDNGDDGFGTTGFAELTGQGFGDDVHVSAPDSGFTADWTFAVAPGTYRIAITWTGDADRASSAPFTILDGGTELTTVLVNQQAGPDDFDDAGVSWEIVGEFTISSGILVIRLSDLGADGLVIADAVRIERIA